MSLELAGDETFLGSDEMEDLYDVAVRGHRTARREDHRQHGGDKYEHENGGAGDDGGSRHHAQPALPEVVIVQRRRGRVRLQAAAHLAEVGRRGAVDAHDDEAGNRQFVQVGARAEPGLQEIADFRPAQRAGRGDAGNP